MISILHLFLKKKKNQTCFYIYSLRENNIEQTFSLSYKIRILEKKKKEMKENSLDVDNDN
jgi:hypothetical protein